MDFKTCTPIDRRTPLLSFRRLARHQFHHPSLNPRLRHRQKSHRHRRRKSPGPCAAWIEIQNPLVPLDRRMMRVSAHHHRDPRRNRIQIERLPVVQHVNRASAQLHQLRIRQQRTRADQHPRCRESPSLAQSPAAAPKSQDRQHRPRAECVPTPPAPSAPPAAATHACPKSPQSTSIQSSAEKERDQGRELVESPTPVPGLLKAFGFLIPYP